MMTELLLHNRTLSMDGNCSLTTDTLMTGNSTNALHGHEYQQVRRQLFSQGATATNEVSLPIRPLLRLRENIN